MAPLTALAEQLLEQARALDAYNSQNNLPPVSFDTESFVELPVEIEAQRHRAIDLATDLRRLCQGPRDLLFELVNQFGDLANLHFIYTHKIPRQVPLDSSISYAELAQATGHDEILLRRMLRVGMMNRLFAETKDGRVTHSALSRLLATESGAMDAVGFFTDEMFPASASMVSALAKYRDSGEPNETGFNLAFSTSRPFYLELESVPERARRFGSGMRWMTQGGRFADKHLVNGVDWAHLDQPGQAGLVVDVGGGHGAVARALANATQHVRFIVQDLPICAAQGAKTLPAELASRVSFMPHDFFEPQPVQGADVYMLRYILHNWSDKYAARILKALVPALKDGSRIVVYEFLPADESSTRWSEKQNYNMDMIQAIGWNSLERTRSDWQRLFKSVDARLEFLGTRVPSGCSCALIEAQFRETSTPVNGHGNGEGNGHSTQ